MAMIASESLSAVYEALKADAARSRRYAALAIEAMLSAVTTRDILDLYERLGRMHTKLEESLLVSDLPAYAQIAEANPTYDLAAETNGVIAAISGAMTWIEVNSGNALDYTVADGVVTPRSFTSAQTSGLRIELQAVVDAIALQ